MPGEISWARECMGSQQPSTVVGVNAVAWCSDVLVTRIFICEGYFFCRTVSRIEDGAFRNLKSLLCARACVFVSAYTASPLVRLYCACVVRV